MMDREIIKHAAVKTFCGLIMFGKNHADCFHKGSNMGLKMCGKRDSQGFMTNKGRFVDRIEGGKLALESGQIDEETKILFSENFWCDQYNGKYDHDEVKGYVLREGEKNVIQTTTQR